MYSVFHVWRPRAGHPELIEHCGDHSSLEEARSHALLVVGDRGGRAEIDCRGATVEIVRNLVTVDAGEWLKSQGF